MTTRTLALIAAAAVTAIAPAAAEAKKSKDSRQQLATFEATLTGTQVTTWNYKDPVVEDDPCDTGIEANGDQTIRFTTERFRFQVAAPPKRQPNMFRSAGRPIVIHDGEARPKLTLTAERNGESLYTPPRGSDCGDNGGPDRDSELLLPDCGERKGSGSARFFYHTDPWETDRVVPAKPDKDWLKLGTEVTSWGGAGGQDLSARYDQCPWMLEGADAEYRGELVPTAVKASERRMFDTRRRKLTISGSVVKPYASGFGSGQTIVAWNLRLKRAK